MTLRTAIFIDGAYLEAVIREEFGVARINHHKLSLELGGGSDILRTYYYHCPAFQGNPPTDEERRRYTSRRRFFSYLERLPRYSVRLGRLERRIDRPGSKPRYEQKRVDILLGVDMVQLAAKHMIQDAILVAGDSDFIPAVIAAKSEGVLVRLFHGKSYHGDLWREADERVRITRELIDSVRLPPAG